MNFQKARKILDKLCFPLNSTLILFCVLIFNRIGILSIILGKHFIDLNQASIILVKGINYDYLFLSIYFAVSSLLYLFLGFFFEKLARSLLVLCGFLLLLLNHCLFGYLVVNNDLLGSELFSYSFEELYYILTSSLADTTISILLFPLLIITLLLYLFLNKKYVLKFSNRLGAAILVILVIVLLVGATQLPYSTPKAREFQSSIEFKYSHTPINSLIHKIIYSPTSKSLSYSDEEIFTAIHMYQSLIGDSLFVSKTYPFLKKYKPYNSLDSLFNLKESSPNIVVLIVESLSRSFSGESAYYGSFTPFLDSLSNHSLTWNNFYSNCPRTYGVIPNLFCSTPIAHVNERGFMRLPNTPNHLSLFKLLYNEDYQNGFYYGGWGVFDNTKGFLMDQNLNTIVDEISYSEEYKNCTSEWGYKDEALFRKYFEDLESRDLSDPLFNVLLTLSIHSPFDQAPLSFDKHIEKIVGKKSKTSEIDEVILSNKPVFRNVLYADSCIADFFMKYSKREDFDNTIFIITGDHNVQALPLVDELDRYHVPFMIYSPMLIKGKSIDAIASHIDLPITLWSLLSERYSFKNPEAIPWVGYGLRTTNDDAVYFAPVNNMENMGGGIYNNDFIIDNKTYEIYNSRLGIETNDTSFIKLMQNYYILNEYACDRNKIYK